MSKGRRDLPSGTVTFLFTDIEGSTTLLHELGAEAYAEALAEHRRILREAFARHGGVEVDTQGDAFFIAFPTAPGAVRAAAEAREALSDGPIQVRMGLHTGVPHVTEEGYVGDVVHEGARIAAAGHGGQVLLSAQTLLHIDVEVADLGEHRLKDIDGAVPIYQLGSGRFPPLKTISNTNLPHPASSFVGREREVVEVASLLQDGIRLLTLTGPGGTGKTRLAIEAASELVPGFKAGVFWVGMAPLRDPALVPEEIAKTLGATDDLAEHIAERDLLLVLDNLEQVVGSAPELASLVETCPNLRLLVTSRELLRVRGEVEYPVAPLADPEAVELFCARAHTEPDETVHELCRALDNLPLALELAAARASVLSPAQILERLSERLDLLRGGRDADPRQQTLRSTIAWSYELLDTEEQRLFARLSVFAGGCTLGAAEQVTDADVDTLQSLVDKSLLRHTDDRFWMLETIREYASELEGGGDGEVIRKRHLDHFLALSERAYEERLASASTWSPIVDAEHDNLRGALDWAAANEPDTAAQLSGAITGYWVGQGHVLEARDRLIATLAQHVSRDRIRARALTELGYVVGAIGDDTVALRYLEEAVDIWRAQDDGRGEATALESIGYTQIALGDLPAAQLAFQRSLSLRQEAGAPELEIAESLAGLCQLLVASGETEKAEPLARELYEIGVSHDVPRRRQSGLHYLADCALIDGHFAEAEDRYTSGLRHARRWGLLNMCTEELLGVAMSTAGRGNHVRAVRLAAAANARKEVLGTHGTSVFWSELQERHIGGGRAHLSPDELERAERAGTDAPFDAVLDEVLGPESAPEAG